MRTLKGKADVLFDRDKGLEIRIEDELSGISICATIPPVEAIAALSRQVHVDCEVSYPSEKGLALIGKKREVEQVLIQKTWEGYRPTRERVLTQCEAEGLLVDGWELWQDGLSTQQNQRGKHRVVIVRYVEPTEQDR